MDPDPTKPQRTFCSYCIKGAHLRCLWRTRDCGCDCPWLVADMREHFPSLRHVALNETEDP